MTRIRDPRHRSYRTVVGESALSNNRFTPVSISDIKDIPSLAALS